MYNHDPLAMLWNSTKGLYRRFGLTPLPNTTSRVFAEEARELVEAQTEYNLLSKLSEQLLPDNDPDYVDCDEYAEVLNRYYDKIVPALGAARTNVVLEAADVIVTVLGILQQVGISYDELHKAMEQTQLKNDAKSERTHEVINGKISKQDKSR